MPVLAALEHTVTLTILYQDRHYVAIHKPANMLVHRSPISRDQIFVLQTLRDQIGRRVYPIHRLDRATSGVLIFGLDSEAAQQLVRHFAARAVRKEYWALARGWVAAHGTIDHPVADEDGNGIHQPAVTHYRCLARVELPVRVDRYPSARYSLVSVNPETGRRQQIRKHFKHISHHLIGDTTHGNGRHNQMFRDRYALDRLMLLARHLGFVHPYSGADIDLYAEPETDWIRLLSELDWCAIDTSD